MKQPCVASPVARPSLLLAKRRASRLSLALLLLTSGPALAADPDDSEISAEAKERPKEMPIVALPVPESLRLPPPTPAAKKAVAEVLAGITSPDAQKRERAFERVLDARADWLAAIAPRIDQVAERRDRSGMEKALDEAVEKEREAMRREGRDEAATRDYLSVLLDEPDLSHESQKNLLELLSLSRMLVQIGNTQASRELIRIYLRFGDFIRIDTQRQLEKLGDRSIAALIETRRHPADMMRKWAETQLRVRNKLASHDAVRTDDLVALHDILEALGRIRDPENGRLLLSFASSQKALVREGARLGIVHLENLAAWQLRDAYLDITGKQPPRDWTWKRSARELFTEFDRLRVQEYFDLYSKAQAAENEPERAAQLYGELLTVAPQFSLRARVAAPLLRAAESLAQAAQDADSPEKKTRLFQLARLSSARALRISEDDGERKRAESLKLLIDAHETELRGFHDRYLIQKALAENPDSALAKELHFEEAQKKSQGLSTLPRYLLALLLGLISLSGIALVLHSIRREKLKEKQENPSEE